MIEMHPDHILKYKEYCITTRPIFVGPQGKRKLGPLLQFSK
jgi:hypothetical protein